MIRLLIQAFIPDAENTQDKQVRERYCVLSGAVGIACNLLLFAVKLTIGALMHSIGILSDAFNNLSDMGSSLISLLSAKLSSRRPDREHPFGHGRIEYIAAFVISFLILLVGFELARNSLDKILHPSPVEFSWLLIGILALSTLVKVWMFSYNRYIGRKIGSAVVEATARDSLGDVIATGAVIVSTAAGAFLPFSIDGFVGLAVSLLVMYTGFGIAKDMVGMLLGGRPSPELVQDIERITRESPEILGVHDLIVHDYGPGRVMASLHAEVADTSDLVKIHEVIDAAERRLRDRLGVEVVIHMDPISQDDEEVARLRALTAGIVEAAGAGLSFHDFRVVRGEARINLVFDLVVPYEYTPEQARAVRDSIADALAQADPRFAAVIELDHQYV